MRKKKATNNVSHKVTLSPFMGAAFAGCLGVGLRRRSSMIESPASAARRHEQLLLPPLRDGSSSKSSEAEDVLAGTRARATTFGLWRSQLKPSPLVPTEKNEKGEQFG